MLSFADPVPTRGWPLVNNVHLNTQVVESRMLGNATFTYDIHAINQTVYVNGVSSTHRTIVDGTGRILDFGAISGGIAPEPGVFSTLTSAGGAYTLSNAGPPESLDQAGNFTYAFNTSGKLVQITDPMGNTQSLAYSPTSGLLTTVTDNNTGKSISFIQVTGPAGGTIIQQNPSGAQTSIGYTSGRVTSINWQGPSTGILKRVDFTYNADGTLHTYTKDQDPNSTVTYSYTALMSTDGVSSVLMANQTAAVGTTHFVWGLTPAPGAADRASSTNNKTPAGTTYYDFNSQGALCANIA
jgi:YD repeat-containing protein